MKIKELCWAIAGTVMTLILGYIMFFGVDQAHDSDIDNTCYRILCGVVLFVMLCLSGIGWSTALPEKDNDNEI